MINNCNICVHYVNSMDDLVNEYTELLKTKIIYTIRMGDCILEIKSRIKQKR